MKILVIALSGIGDALMFTPALKLISKAAPDSEIDVLVMLKGAKDIFERNENINKVIYFNFLEEGAFNSLKFVSSLRKKYDASINVYPSNRKEYNIISFLIGAKRRAGVEYLRKNSQNFGFLNNIRFTEEDTLHNVQTNIILVEKLLDVEFDEEPDLDFPLTKNDISYAKSYLGDLRIQEGDLAVGFHPGSAALKNHKLRRWEPDKFAELGKRLINEYNAKILIFGGPEENELKNYINDKINSGLARNQTVNSNLVNTDNLAQSAAIMKSCKLFVSNDSSLMHVASAMKLNVIAIIGPTNPAYIYPWNTKHKIVSLGLDCSPCFIYSPRPLICFRDDIKFKCIKELTVDMVYQAVTKFIN
ncbi:MAG: lipopolysaccharide heptosyltransferase II [Ignavibacteriaceae bacterium]